MLAASSLRTAISVSEVVTPLKAVGKGDVVQIVAGVFLSIGTFLRRFLVANVFAARVGAGPASYLRAGGTSVAVSAALVAFRTPALELADVTRLCLIAFSA